MEWIAHRAGNLPETIGPAAARADVLELDVHTFRGRLEVRHGKVLWPFARQWEQWYLLPTDAPRPPLVSILDAMPEGVHIWVDLKGYTSGLTRRVLAALGDRRPVTMSTRNWWILGPARRAGSVRVMGSVGNRAQRWLITHLPLQAGIGGVVVNERLVDAAFMDRIHRRTPTVISWGVTDAGRAAELVRLGISGLIVDDLDLIDQTAALV